MNSVNLGVYKFQGNNNYPIWHPYSNIDGLEKLKLTRGEGVYVFDSDGRKLLDATSGLWNMSLGYSNRAIEEAITQQVSTLPFCSLFEHTNDRAIEAASAIIRELGPNFQKVFYTCSGSESIELALKISIKYWQLLGKEKKRKALSLKQSYHGTYYGSMGVSGSEISAYHEFGMPSETVFLDYVEEQDIFEEETFKQIEEYIESNCDSIACIVIESILASEGVKIVHPKYLEWISKLCAKNDILVVLDEVALGFYRTGTAFYYQQYGVVPDIVCLAKGINAGYLPMGATVLSKKIYSVYSYYNDYLAHGSTQGGNLVSCAACIAAIQEYQKNEIGKNVEVIGKLLLSELKTRIMGHPNVDNVKGKGLLIGIDFVIDKETKLQPDVNFVKRLQKNCEERGVIVYTSKAGLTIIPPLIISEAEMEYLVKTISDVIYDELL